jgi:hypothetical protein
MSSKESYYKLFTGIPLCDLGFESKGFQDQVCEINLSFCIRNTEYSSRAGRLLFNLEIFSICTHTLMNILHHKHMVHCN